jgi:V/A-type H+-transporting ATPase subunit C
MGDLARYAAVNARVRTLLPGLLGADGLAALARYPTLAAVRGALAQTPYGAAADGGTGGELSLQHRVAAVAPGILATTEEPERGFLREVLLRRELENLKIVVRAVHHRIATEDVVSRIVPVRGAETLDARRLLVAADLRDLRDRLRGSAYEAAFASGLPLVEKSGPFAVEVALELDYYERLWDRTRALRPRDARLAQALLGVLYDVLNLGWIVRYRDVLGLSREEIINYTLPQGRWLASAARDALAGDPSLPLEAVLARTPYAPALERSRVATFEQLSTGLLGMLAGEMRRGLRGYPFHIGVPLGFLLLLEIEIRDLETLLAAKGLGEPAELVMERLASLRVSERPC